MTGWSTVATWGAITAFSVMPMPIISAAAPAVSWIPSTTEPVTTCTGFFGGGQNQGRHNADHDGGNQGHAEGKHQHHRNNGADEGDGADVLLRHRLGSGHGPRLAGLVPRLM